MTMSKGATFEAAARRLLARLGLPRGGVALHQASGGFGKRKIVVELEEGARPAGTPDMIDGYPVEYRWRRVLKVR